MANKAIERGVHKREDGKWYEPDGTPYLVKKGSGEQHPALVGNDFKARKENINTTGIRRSVGSIIDDMKKADESGEGVRQLDKKTLMELYKTLFNTTTWELEKLLKRPDTPLGIAIIIDTLLDKKTRARAWNDYQQWVYGKAPEAGELSKVEDDINFESLTPKEQEAYDVMLKKVANDY